MSGNPVNIRKLLADQKTEILYEIDDKNTVTRDQISSEATQTQSDLADALVNILAKIILENNENEAILDSLTTVNGSIDSSATAINSHTDDKVDEVKSELVRTTSGSLYKYIVDEIKEGSAGNSLKLVKEALLLSINSARDLIRGASSRDLTQIYNIVNSLPGGLADIDESLSSRATTVQIDAASDLIRGASSRDLTQVYNLVNAVAKPSDLELIASSAELNNSESKIINAQNRPRILNDGFDSNQLANELIVNVPQSSGLTNALNIVGSSGVLYFLEIGKSIDCEVWIDGIKVISVAREDYIDGSNMIVNTADQQAMPPVVYKSGLSIKYSRQNGPAKDSDFVKIGRIKHTGV